VQRIRLFQPVEGFLVVPFIDKMIPFRDQVADGTARPHAAPGNPGMAERNAAVHATRRLLTNFSFALRGMKRVPVLNARLAGLLGSRLSVIF